MACATNQPQKKKNTKIQRSKATKAVTTYQPQETDVGLCFFPLFLSSRFLSYRIMTLVVVSSPGLEQARPAPKGSRARTSPNQKLPSIVSGFCCYPPVSSSSQNLSLRLPPSSGLEAVELGNTCEWMEKSGPW